MNTIFYPSWLYRHRILVAIIISVTGLAYLLLKSLLFRQITEPLLQWVIEGMVVCVIAPALIWQGLEWGNKLFQDYKQAQQKFQALEGVYATALDIISQLDLEQVLDSIVSRCAILVGAYSGYLTLYDKDKDLVRVVSTYPPQQEDIGREIQRGRGLSGEVIETGQIKIINDYLK